MQRAREGAEIDLVERDRRDALREEVEPLLVVVLGVVIGTIVLALFLPLVKMIESVSGGA